MRKRCERCWSVCCDDRAGDGNADLDRGGSDGHAALIYGARRDGADGAGAESVFRASVCVSRQARRSDQVAVVGWRWAVLVRQEAGAWAVSVATSGERHGCAHASAAVDVVGRHRLEATGAQLRAADGGVSKIILIFPHI